MGGPTYQVASIHEPGGSRGSAGWKKDQKKNAIDTSVECYHLATQNLCTALPSPGPTYQVASIHEPGGSRGSAGWKKDKKKRNRYLGGMLPFGNPKSLYQLFPHLGLHTR